MKVDMRVYVSVCCLYVTGCVGRVAGCPKPVRDPLHLLPPFPSLPSAP